MNTAPLDTHDDPGIETIVAGLTHDLRNSLAIIKGLAALTADAIARGDGTAATEMLGQLDVTVGKGSALCADVLECSVRRRTHPRAPLELAPFDVAQVVRDCTARSAGLFVQARCSLEVRLPATLPLTSHQPSLERIIINLLTNAVRYGAGRRVEVHLHAVQHGAMLVVRDYGRGIPRAALETLFEPYRGDRDQRFERFGLGLWIVRSLVQSLGGQVNVLSEPGLGTAFTFWLPNEPDRPYEHACGALHELACLVDPSV